MCNAQGVLSRITEICPVKLSSFAAPPNPVRSAALGGAVWAHRFTPISRAAETNVRSTREFGRKCATEHTKNSTEHAGKFRSKPKINSQLTPNQRVPKRNTRQCGRIGTRRCVGVKQLC